MRVNEMEAAWTPGLTLAVVRRRHKPEADLVIRNGFPVDARRWEEEPVAPEDAVVLIRRGETPTGETLHALMAARHSPGVAAALRTAAVGIAGAGGLGSHVAAALARMGVGRLVVADFDVVEPSNLNRQNYRVADLGRPKAEALAEGLAAIHPGVRVTARRVEVTAENAVEIFDGCGVVCECFDRPEAKRMLVECLLAADPSRPVVAASGLAGLGDANAIRTRRAAGGLVLVGDGTSAAAPGTGLMATRVLVAAGHQAHATVRLLLGERVD